MSRLRSTRTFSTRAGGEFEFGGCTVMGGLPPRYYVAITVGLSPHAAPPKDRWKSQGQKQLKVVRCKVIIRTKPTDTTMIENLRWK